ncbi:hypothetical protein LCGC14_1683240 [marine sediment metagenome]|uniref:Uncharacterized protein n=1 Tax=marine sediment metagenome TaxID=412755 RepID=A0A0F9IAF0_9ZZZZ|nr:hypothetical protein [Candidatus Scalindua sp.]
MNKETIDYAIEKLNIAFQAIKPDAIELGSEYIDYIVFQTMLSPIFSCIVFICLLLITMKCFKMEKEIEIENGQRYKESDEIIYAIIGRICGIIAFISIIVTFLTLYNAILASMYPLMYTIEKLL